MLSADRIVTQLPLATLWNDQGDIASVRKRFLNKADIKEILKQSSILFVVADISYHLMWLPIGQCYQFWKDEAMEHIADNLDYINVDNFKGGYSFIASEWTSDDKISIVLLEKVH